MTLFAEIYANGDCKRKPSLQMTRLEAVHLMHELSAIVRNMPGKGKRSFDVSIDSVITRSR